jgi:uncharacterized hydrophobic protein (TIGR00271 family)
VAPTEQTRKPILEAIWERASRHAFIEPPMPVDKVEANMDAAGRPVLAFYLMLGLATIIGTSGMLANSAGVIIGAMIVAPLMNPIVALSFCLASARWRSAGLALFLLVTGIALTILLAYVGTNILGLRIVGSEILGRTQPTLLDLGVALAAGAAAAFANSRQSIANVLPGTAIAVALVPPLCVVGIGLGTGVTESGISYVPLGPSATGLDVAWGALILFLTNLAGILLASEFVFLIHGYGTLRKGILGIAVTLLASVLLSAPLGGSLRDLYSRSTAMKVATAMAAERTRDGDTPGTVLDLRVYHDSEDVLTVEVKGMLADSATLDVRARPEQFQRRLSEALGEPVRVRAEALVVPVHRITVEADPP